MDLVRAEGQGDVVPDACVYLGGVQHLCHAVPLVQQESQVSTEKQCALKYYNVSHLA